MFKYNGYHFEPERNLKECEDKNLYILSKHLKSDTELEEGTPDEVFSNPKNERTKEFLSKVLK